MFPWISFLTLWQSQHTHNKKTKKPKTITIRKSRRIWFPALLHYYIQMISVLQKNHKAYKEAGKYSPFKGKNNHKLSLKKNLGQIYWTNLLKNCFKDTQRTKRICGNIKSKKESKKRRIQTICFYYSSCFTQDIDTKRLKSSSKLEKAWAASTWHSADRNTMVP